jgi:hypothetical protein
MALVNVELDLRVGVDLLGYEDLALRPRYCNSETSCNSSSVGPLLPSASCARYYGKIRVFFG